jgi:hypothetical protein
VAPLLVGYRGIADCKIASSSKNKKHASSCDVISDEPAMAHHLVAAMSAKPKETIHADV